MNKLEISVGTKEEAIIAEQGGADRLELAIKSERGGLTPSFSEISNILLSTKLPCYILIRPKLDSYNLTNEDFNLMLHIVELVKMTSAKGVSIGLLKNGRVDKIRLEKIIKNKGHLELVFNHAIDSVYKYEEELEYLIDNDGVDWIQTTGSAETIIDGYSRITPLLGKIKNKLIIGRALDSNNIKTLLNEGFDDIVYQCKSSLTHYDETREILSIDKIIEFSKILKGNLNE